VVGNMATLTTRHRNEYRPSVLEQFVETEERLLV
jgi:hypothetical protein